MIKVENIDVWGFEHAIRGMRNPMNSWDKSDSGLGCHNSFCVDSCGFKPNWCPYTPKYKIGPNDLGLMRRLYKAGTEHRKYLRQIFVSMDITAPLYWWKEWDTYKFVVPDPHMIDADSCSTMHKIAAKEFELDDFSHEHLISDEPVPCKIVSPQQCLEVQIQVLNAYREMYLEYKDKKYWWQMIQLLPSSYNQKRTLTMSYETLMSIRRERTGHKLDEWRELVKILDDLPYVKELAAE